MMRHHQRFIDRVECIDEAVEAAFLSYTLSSSARARVVLHLSQCPVCYDRIALLLFARNRSRFLWYVAAVFIVLLLVASVAARWMIPRSRGMAALVATAKQSQYRYVRARLSAPFPYRPLRAPAGDPVRLSRVPNERIRGAPDSSAAENLHVSGVQALLAGKSDESVEALERAIGSTSDLLNRIAVTTDANLLNDLAVAYYEHSIHRGSVSDLTVAFSASARAINVDREHAPAWFVHALALEALAMNEDAAASWVTYLELDGTSEWASEARSHLQKLAKAATAEDAKGEMFAAAAAQNRVLAETLVSLNPQQARMTAEEEVLGTWGDSVLRGDAADADRKLNVARIIGDAIARYSGDRTIIEAVSRIDARSRDSRLLQLAGAHVAYWKAREMMENARDARARDALRVAGEALQAAASPLAERAFVYTATITHYLGDNDAALATLSLVLDGLRGHEEEYPVATAQALWTRALIEYAKGRPYDALRSATEARRHIEKTHERSNTAGIDIVLADTWRYLGDLENAWRHRLLALRGVARNAPYIRRQIVIAEASAAALQSGHLALAQLLNHRLQANASRKKDYIFRARALTGEARIAVADNSFEDALLLLDRATLVLYSRPLNGTTMRLAADLAIDRAQILAHRDAAAAEASLLDALARLERLNHRTRYPRIQLLLGRIREQRDERRGAEAAYLAGLRELETERSGVPSDQQRSLFTDTGRGLYEAAVRLLLERNAEQEALQIVRRGRAMGFASPDMEPYRDALSDVPPTVPPGSAFVEYYSLPDTLLAWVTKAGETHYVEIPMTRDALDRSVTETVARLRRASTKETAASATSALYDSLIRPVSQWISSDCSLIVAPDSVLHRVPFAALYDRAAHRFLIERHALTIALGAGVPSAYAGFRSILVAAGPSGVDGLPPLAEVTREAIQAAKIFPTSHLLIAAEATPSRFLAEAGDYEIVHFAGHAFGNERWPALATLRLAADERRPDGALYSYDLQGLRFSRTRMVVLSACNTAGGRLSGSGILSFARVFTAAGVPAVVGSFWPAEDRATAALFEAFYHALQHGSTAADALRAAQMSAIGSREFSRPSIWSNFQLYGSSMNE
jgi:CHAT domain-containing protein